MKRILYFLLGAAASGLVAWAAPKYSEQQMSPDHKLRMAAAVIDNYYVEEVNSDTMVTEAIKAMLKTLDPHSQYSTPSETEELNQPLEGKFSGIGIQFNMVEDTVYVIQTTPGGPSEKMGIRPGDRIISANDTVIAGKKLKNSGIIKVLRGPKGSVVNLKVKRGGVPELIDFRLVRDDIPIYSVDASYMVDDTTGFVSVTRFAESTGEEVRRAVDSLSHLGMRNLILDLQSNGGGYLGSAYEMASDFLRPGDPVVSTKGLHFDPQMFTVQQSAMLPVDRLVIMVDQYSASASEILSGAVQENDRGLIVGRRTFGKGLVQRPFPFPDGSMIRLTTARYYTPTGRCIQKPYVKGHTEEYQLDLLNRYNSGELWHADSIHLDSTEVYHTLHYGRPVYGGGGIMPDVFVPVDTSYYTPYYRDLMAKGSIMKYALGYIEKHREALLKKYPAEADFAAKFPITEEMTRGLIARGETDDVKFNEEQWKVSRPIIEAVLRGLMTRDLYENGIYVRSIHPLSPEFQEAYRLINDPERYYRILQGK